MNFQTSNLISQSLLGIFFLYLVLLGSDIQSVLNCGIQKFVKKNVFIRHVLVFLSIFIFTFILNWYTFDSIIVKESFVSEINVVNYTYILKSFIYSISIYLLFLVSTKTHIKFLVPFLVLLFISFFIFIFYKIHNDNIKSDSLNLDDFLLITPNQKEKILQENKDINVNEFNIVFLLKNILFFIYFSMLICLILGFNLYYQKQRKEQKKWDFVKFLFGTNNCSNL